MVNAASALALVFQMFSTSRPIMVSLSASASSDVSRSPRCSFSQERVNLCRVSQAVVSWLLLWWALLGVPSPWGEGTEKGVRRFKPRLRRLANHLQHALKTLHHIIIRESKNLMSARRQPRVPRVVVSRPRFEVVGLAVEGVQQSASRHGRRNPRCRGRLAPAAKGRKMR